jgi:asparagine synthase (glutamine-hydrolysing)
MAHGLESRVPFLDHPLVELLATIPSNIKFKDGTMKQVLKTAMKPLLPETIMNRKDKMGFPVPLTQWIKKEAKEFIYDIFSSEAALSRELINNRKVLNGLAREPEYGRKIWGMLCLELWQQEFHDKEHEFKKLLARKGGGT